MFFMKGYVSRDDRHDADKKLPRLMIEGLFLGGTGLGVLALIFEIASDAFSVAAYQTLLAIEGAHGHHDVAMLAFTALSIMLFFGIVPAYKAGAYLKPNAGGSGPLVEAVGPERMRWLSWIGTSMFFIDAVLTIIISSIAATDATLLVLPELAGVRVVVAEIYAFFIMSLLVIAGPKRAVPVFLAGGGAFTVFTLFALNYVGLKALTDPNLGSRVADIVKGLEDSGIVSHSVPAIEQIGGENVVSNLEPLTVALFFQYFLRSMSSAMLGFSGYEVIPASGKHAARPKWKVINTALIIAAIFLISTGVLQLFAAKQWQIPATEGYSTLLIQYQLVFGGGSTLLLIAGILLALILLLAQGGGYVGGAAVAANAARLGRLPRPFEDDRVGIVVIWLVAAIFIPIIPSVTQVESFYAFGFVSAFVITSTTIFFVRDDVLIARGIEPGSDPAKALRFAGLRGMFASYFMAIVLVTQKTAALPPIVVAASIITLFQYLNYHGYLRRIFPLNDEEIKKSQLPGRDRIYSTGRDRALDEARQHGIAAMVADLLTNGSMVKFNVEPARIQRLIGYMHDILPITWIETAEAHHHGERIEQPCIEQEQCYKDAYAMKDEIVQTVEHYSHYGIFTFIDKYSHNWVSDIRDLSTVQKTMIKALFPRTSADQIWAEFNTFRWQQQPEEVWQFSRERYHWAKNQWPNISTHVTTIWTLQDIGIDVTPDVFERVTQPRPIPTSMQERNEIRENGKDKTDLEDADTPDTE